MSVTPRSRLASSTPFVSGARCKRLYSTWFGGGGPPGGGAPLVPPPHLLRTVVAHAYPADLASLDRLRQGLHQTAYPENRVREVDLVEVYRLYPESLQTLVHRLQK